MSASEDILDVAIVGGGISGLYAGWRLRTGEGSGKARGRVVLFEGSGRTGGRLLTWYPFPDRPELHAELGGMRFFAQQELVWGLVTRQFADKLQGPIKFHVTDPNGNNLWYLRETILKGPDFNDPERVPYRQDAQARYAGPSAIIQNVIASVMAENRVEIAALLGGRTAPRTREDWDAVKPVLRYRGRRLWNVGFWNLLYDLLSPESYTYVTDAFGYSSLTNNWNAAEAMQSIAIDFTENPDYQTLAEGYGYLPRLIRDAFVAAGGEVRLRQPVTAVERDDDGVFTLSIGGGAAVRARRVILAMPRRSLELLRPSALWNPDRTIGTRGRSLREYLESVIPYPAFKMFMAYERAWWHQPPMSIAAGRSVSDLPLRQTYYFPPVPAFPVGQPPPDGPALLMTSYDDYTSVPFWRTLEAPEKYKAEANAAFGAAVSAHAFTAERTAAPSFRAHVDETTAALEEDPGFNIAPPEMVRYAQQQLRLLHFNQALPDPLPLPGRSAYFLAAYQDWGHDPYGGGWNFWAPSVDVKDVMEVMRRPFGAEADLYVVGEAYSGSQAWAEGALTLAEKTLQDHFGLARPSWLRADYYLGY